MGRAILEFLELAARQAGMHGLAYWLRDYPYALLFIVAGIFGLGFLAWFLGRAGMHPNDVSEDEGTTIIRGGCMLVVLGGFGLIFIAAVVWAWRFLFG